MPVHADVKELLMVMEEILDAEGTPEGAAPADEAFQKAQAIRLSWNAIWKTEQRRKPMYMPLPG